MTDLALIQTADGGFDIALDAFGQLQLDDGLRSAIILSLFSDARAANDDPLPQLNADRRGWWGDVVSPVAGWEQGSKLWLLAREKQTQSVLTRARDYARAALAWMIDDQVASAIEIEASFPQRGVLALGITIARPDGPARQRYDFAWNATEQQLRAA